MYAKLQVAALCFVMVAFALYLRLFKYSVIVHHRLKIVEKPLIKYLRVRGKFLALKTLQALPCYF